MEKEAIRLMAWLPEFSPEELEMLRKDRPDLLAILEDPGTWKKWDQVIKPANGLLWDYFEESIGRPHSKLGPKTRAYNGKSLKVHSGHRMITNLGPGQRNIAMHGLKKEAQSSSPIYQKPTGSASKVF